ncbi:MAG TPA: CDP-alcohol phosphatidyltransferase family protein [Bryobacteraceae bacterium]|jgi:phosphatidylglycerophosphate synthase|nr:CDP-alcohol phosphatidyltransferase family protein [Bryobacteraceae bacterium]
MAVESWNRRPLRSRNTAWAARLARLLIQLHVRPNPISLASLAASAAAGYCLLRAWYPAAALFILLRLLCNLMDGMVAIEGGLGSASGEIYNDLPDRISDALILCAAGYSLPWPAYARELGWSAALLSVMTAYIRILGGASGLPQDFRGPMAKPHRMAVLIAAGLLAPFDTRFIALALVVVIAGSLVTAALRLRRIVRQLEDGSRSLGQPRDSGDR